MLTRVLSSVLLINRPAVCLLLKLNLDLYSNIHQIGQLTLNYWKNSGRKQHFCARKRIHIFRNIVILQSLEHGIIFLTCPRDRQTSIFAYSTKFWYNQTTFEILAVPHILPCTFVVTYDPYRRIPLFQHDLVIFHSKNQVITERVFIQQIDRL